MKTIINLFLYCFALFALLACTEEEFSEAEHEISHSKIWDPTLTLSFGCTIARAIEIRPRDGEPCGCEACFGLCNCGFKLNISFNPFGMISDPNEDTPIVIGVEPSGEIVVYIPENAGLTTEQEFGIDEKMVFSKNDEPDLNVELIEIYAGTYTFHADAQQIEYAPGKFMDCEGYVIVQGQVVY